MKHSACHTVKITGTSTILLAEDDDGHAELITKNLRRSGVDCSVVRFRDGEETLEFLMKVKEQGGLEKEGAYVLFLDIRMPKIDGTEILRRIKQDEMLQNIPVIMITTTDDPREIDHCLELGCCRYLTKPIDYDKFIDAIQQLGRSLLPDACHSQPGPREE